LDHGYHGRAADRKYQTAYDQGKNPLTLLRSDS
jgi:hypothetical protein